MVALRVLVADDRPPFRNAARAVLDVADGFEIVGEAGSGEEAVEAVEALRPDLVVMDVVMKGIGGIEATKRIVAARPETVVVLVSSYGSDDVRKMIADSGAAGFVPKDRFSAATLEGLLLDRAAAPPRRGTREPP
jgi:two-component system, NarL family, invasion response regulator UvrY